MLLVYALLGLLAVGAGFAFVNLNRSITKLSHEHHALHDEHKQLQTQHIELRQYCNTLETRVQYLERSRRLLSYIVKNANLAGNAEGQREMAVRNRYVS